MKRLNVTINGSPAGPTEIRAACKASKPKKMPKPKNAARKHRKMSEADKAAKIQVTQQKKKERKAAREAKELEQLMRRIKGILARQARELDKPALIGVSYKAGSQHQFEITCPLSLYGRVFPRIQAVVSKHAARTSSDGYRNIVLKKTSRGYGKKQEGTREYSDGEAGDLVRYIFRDDAIEEVFAACFTNLIGPGLAKTEGFGPERVAEMVDFFHALEEIEKCAREGGNVYSHLILAMPYELGPLGRTAALEQFCDSIQMLGLPFAAALHKPDPEGNQRNYHAHVIIAFRGFEYDGPSAWSLHTDKASEFNTGAGLKWFRERAATVFNACLASRGLDIKYSGLSQAERRVAAAAQGPKGQVVVALERGAQRDLSKARKVLEGVTLHVAKLISGIESFARELGQQRSEHLRQERIRREEERAEEEKVKAQAAEADALLRQQAQREAAHQAIDAFERELEERRQREAKSDSPENQPTTSARSEPVQEAVSSAERELEERRQRQAKSDSPEKRNQLLEEARIPQVTLAMERLHVALRAVDPPRLVLARDSGYLRAAYRDPAIGEALVQISKEPQGLEWLRGLAEGLRFDHAAVPHDWSRVELFRSHTSPPQVDGGQWAHRFAGASRPTTSTRSEPVQEAVSSARSIER